MIRRIRQDFSALFGSTGRPAFSTVVCWGCAALAYPLATQGGYAGAVGAAIVFSLSVLFLAYLLGAGALTFVVDAKRSCLPGSQRLARRANLLATALLLPVLVLTFAALAGNPVWPAWVPPVLVLATALAGALASRRPTFAVGLFLLVVLAASWTASGRGAHERGKEWFFPLLGAAIVLLTAAIPLLAAVKWRWVIGPDSRSPSLAERLRALRVRLEQRRALNHAPGMASSRHGARERQPPIRIVRTCLGGVFGQLSRQLIIGAMLLILFVIISIGLPWLGATGWRWAVTILALLAAGSVSSGFLTQLSNLTRAQLAELALIPGFGTPAAQRRALCRAVLTPPLVWLGVVLLLGSAELLLKGEPLSSVGMLAVCLVVMGLVYTVLALQKLTNLPPKPQSFISELMLLYLFVYGSGNYYWVYVTHLQIRAWFWFWISPILLGVGVAGAIGLSLRRLAAAPHPFLS